MNEDIKWIRSHVETGDYQFRKHAAERASERGINPIPVNECHSSSFCDSIATYWAKVTYSDLFFLRFCLKFDILCFTVPRILS